MLGLRFCVRAFSSCGKRGPLFIAVRGPLIITASLVAEHRLQMRRLSNCGSRAQLLRGMWDPPRTGLEPVSPALAGRFSTTASRGKPREAPFLMLNNASIYKYTSDCLSKLLKRDFWVVSYDLSDRGYLKCVEFCLMDWYVASFCNAPRRLEEKKRFSKDWVWGLWIFLLPIVLNPHCPSFSLCVFVFSLPAWPLYIEFVISGNDSG